MPFVLEALEAKQGDALLLHYGKGSDPKLIVIDGGPSGVCAGSLKPRLDEIKQERSLRRLRRRRARQPEVSTFQMISDARGQDEFTIHLTHGILQEDPRPNKLLDFFRNEKQAGKQYKTAVREEGALGIAVDLLV